MAARDLEHIPVPVDQLDPTRASVIRDSTGLRHFTDTLLDEHRPVTHPWIGYTIFQLTGSSRAELGLHAYAVSTAKQVGKKEDRRTAKDAQRSV